MRCLTASAAPSRFTGSLTTSIRRLPKCARRVCRKSWPSGSNARSKESDMTDLTPGSLIDGFRLEEKLYQGGMAELWRVTRGDIAFPIVMKVPRIDYGDDPAAIVGFELEQMILPTLAGHHVPRFVAAGDFTTQPHIVMELIEGKSLRARLDAAPLPLDEITEVGARVAAALHDLHRQHVIHLDI